MPRRTRHPFLACSRIDFKPIGAATAALTATLALTSNAYAWPSTVLGESQTMAEPEIAVYNDITPVDVLTTSPVQQVMVNSINGISVSFVQTQGIAQPRHRTIAPDPWQKLNRFTFNLNDRSDKLIFVPLAKGYRKVTTKKMRKALRNFLANLNTPTVLVNDILQGKFKRAAQTSGRFVINSTVGFGGMADPAARLGIAPHTEDFGQTLAVWGLPSGPYVVLPFFGPSTVRDGLGLAVDRLAFSPLNYIQTPAAQKARLSRTGATLLSAREPLLEPLADIERNSLDYYSSFRSFYLQARRREILDGQTALDDLPDIGDEFDEFDEFDDFEEGQDEQDSEAQSPDSGS